VTRGYAKTAPPLADANCTRDQCDAPAVSHVLMKYIHHDSCKARAHLLLPVPTTPPSGSSASRPVIPWKKYPNVSKVAINLRESISATHNNWGAMLYEKASDAPFLAPCDGAGRPLISFKAARGAARRVCSVPYYGIGGQLRLRKLLKRKLLK
jgi:hypothetical protein